MIINSYNTEFGYELVSAIPYAYWAYKCGLLKKTISAHDTKCLYYFSPNHEENNEPRSWYNTPKAVKIPNIDIHKPYLKLDKFAVPDYKNQYKNDIFKWEKPTVVICNRINVEWNRKPINLFDLQALHKIFNLLKDYQIIYINIHGKRDYYDNAEPIYIGDYDVLYKYSNVINIHDLHKKHSHLTFNELQLMIFANCEKFITMNGGHALLAAYFGGENLIYSRDDEEIKAKELHPSINSFYRWYHYLGNQRVQHVATIDNLLSKIESMWVKKEPIINILVRTANRPNYFKTCIDSILKQTYKNINIFVSIDDDYSDKYTVPYPVYPVFVKRNYDVPPPPTKGMEYGIAFPYNRYLNELQNKVQNGIIMYLDDDDEFKDIRAVENIVNAFKNGADMVFWKVQIGNRIIPSEINFGRTPVVKDISGIGFAFHSEYKKYAVWTPYKRADYRVAKELYEKIENKVFINKIFTKSQTSGNGFGQRKDKIEPIMTREKIKVKIIKNTWKKVILPYQIGDIVELSGTLADNFRTKGICVFLSDIDESIKREKILKEDFEFDFKEQKTEVETKEFKTEIKTKKGRKPKKIKENAE